MTGPPELLLRFMNANDVDAVAALDRSTFSTGWSPDAYRKELENPTARYLVLLGDGGFVGFGGVWIIVDQAHIVTVTIAPPERGKGYGGLLVHGLMMLAATFEVDDVTLEVRESNAVARAMYHGYGFLEVGRRVRYYEDGEDALILTTEALSTARQQQVMARRRSGLDARFPGVLEACAGLLAGGDAAST